MLPELSEVVGSASLSVASVIDLVLGRVHHVLEHIHDVGAAAFAAAGASGINKPSGGGSSPVQNQTS